MAARYSLRANIAIIKATSDVTSDFRDSYDELLFGDARVRAARVELKRGRHVSTETRVAGMGGKGSG